MPPKVKITRDDILDAAVELVRERGAEALTTRSLAARLNCSTQPIFSNFPNMDALNAAVFGKVYERYAESLLASLRSEKYPSYKASGMAYIKFAVEEPRLFRLLFMRDRSGEERVDDTAESEMLIDIIMKNTGLSSASAHLLHHDMWVLVHGLAVMYATGFQEYNQQITSEMVTDVYFGLLARLKEKERMNADDGN